MRNPFLPAQSITGKARGVLSLWKSITSFSVEEIAREAEQPFTLALIGTADQTALLAARLALETPIPRDSSQGPADIRAFFSVHPDAQDAPIGAIVLDADSLTANEAQLSETLGKISADHPGLRLSLARHIPAFRPAVCAVLINESSLSNAKIAVLSALPGIIPFTDILMPATALGDMVLLTKNQTILLLQIAAAYGLPVDVRARLKELLPVVGSAFGWRAIARELIGLVPGGIGVVVKGSVAYAGTFTVGKAAAFYYSTGQTLSGPRLKQLYREALGEAGGRVRQLVRRKRPDPSLPMPVTPQSPV